MVDSSKHDVHVHVLPAPGRVDQRLLELAVGGTRSSSSELTNGTGSAVCGITPLRRILPRQRRMCCALGTLSHGTHTRHPKMRRVLVATDLSTHGGYPVPYAWSMVEPGGVVRLMTVVKPPELHERRLAHLQADSSRGFGA